MKKNKELKLAIIAVIVSVLTFITSIISLLIRLGVIS